MSLAAVEQHSPPASPPENLSLGDRLARIRDTQAMLRDPNFDPARDLGSIIDDDVEAMMQKVDGNVAWARACDDHAANCARLAKMYAAEASAAANNAKRTRAYLLYQLALDKKTEFVGHNFVVRKVRASNKASVVEKRQPTAEDFLEYGESIMRRYEPIPERYEWDKNKLYSLLKADEQTRQSRLFDLFDLDYGEDVAFDPIGKPVEKKRKAKNK